MKIIATALLGLGLLAGASMQAEAAIALQPIAPDGQVIQVFGGCGPLGHRGPYGGCRAGGQLGGYIPGRSCPPGFHIGPYGRRCWPNR